MHRHLLGYEAAQVFCILRHCWAADLMSDLQKPSICPSAIPTMFSQRTMVLSLRCQLITLQARLLFSVLPIVSRLVSDQCLVGGGEILPFGRFA